MIGFGKPKPARLKSPEWGKRWGKPAAGILCLVIGVYFAIIVSQRWGGLYFVLGILFILNSSMSREPWQPLGARWTDVLSAAPLGFLVIADRQPTVVDTALVVAIALQLAALVRSRPAVGAESVTVR